MELQRSAGILLHVASLPGSMGIGDLGSGAYKFIDWLSKSGQKWWQILPLGPLTAENQPYSSQSSWAGAYEYIDIVGLVEDGDLRKVDIKDALMPESSKVVYEKVRPLKEGLLDLAAENFFSDRSGVRYAAYLDFCKDEKWWLDDWALFAALKNEHDNKPWWEWDSCYALRDKKALADFIKNNKEQIEKHKYRQFVFCVQWQRLKDYAADKGVQILGDLPIYCSRDSQDVWSAINRFEYDEKGKLLGQAGVPPDCFSETGQLWGMPVYNWEVHKAEKFKWWIDRLKGSFSKADLVRLDHFMGFVRYYDIPAEDKDAKRGVWKEGPNDEFFKAVRKAFGDAPFVAEDLGDITEEICACRDRWGLPGMKVLQFAFDGNPENGYLPHNHVRNCVVYTGTHDNDTTAGWFKTLSKTSKEYYLKYVGKCSEYSPVRKMIRCAYGSIAALVIVPMQDVLELGSVARQNLPGGEVKGGNYRWKLTSKDLSLTDSKWLNELVDTFGR